MLLSTSQPPPTRDLTPSLAEVHELIGPYNVVPLQRTFIDDCQTPVTAFLKLREGFAGEPAFLLESARRGTHVGRYSFIGVQPKEVVRWSLGDGGDPYAVAEAVIGRYRAAPLPALPPFSGGAVGLFGYDLARAVEPAIGEPNPDPVGLPDLALMLSDAVVVFDHLKHTITVLANVYADDASEVPVAYARAADTIAEVCDRLAGPLPDRAAQAAPATEPEFASNMSREQFEANVSRIIDYIRAGDAYQVVPSQRWSAAFEKDGFSIYRGLRAANPSPYMYFLDFGDFQVAGASPEPLLTVTGDVASTRPAAGTRGRGRTPADDEALATELLADEKERAEHLMLVDLGRNDLGRVCARGTVEVDALMEVEQYSTVMHIVSNVRGRLAPGVSALSALRAVLPAGTLSGAPKIRAMQIIDELEPVKRGAYGGAVGWVSYTGDMDTCIHIRTVVLKDRIAHVQAGGGTVADARPDLEYEESVNKSRAAIQAVELAMSEETWQ